MFSVMHLEAQWIERLVSKQQVPLSGGSKALYTTPTGEESCGAKAAEDRQPKIIPLSIIDLIGSIGICDPLRHGVANDSSVGKRE